MRTNPGRRIRRAQRYGHRAPTRMTEHQRYQQACAGPYDRMLDHLGIIDVDIVDDDHGTGHGDPTPPPTAAGRDNTHPITDTEPHAYQLAILAALQDKPVYQGSVHVDVIARRRARNKAARRARRARRADRAAFALLMVMSLFIGAIGYYASDPEIPAEVTAR